MLEKEDFMENACPLCAPAPEQIYRDPAERVPLAEIIARCDELFQAEKTAELGEHLRSWRIRAAELGDKKGELSILNELIGHYRMTNDPERGLAAVSDAFRLIGEVGISGSVSAGTILLNGATALKAFGDVKNALRHYAEAFRCYNAHLAPEDVRFAGLLNNMAAAYLDNGEGKYAEAYYHKALDILRKNGNLMDEAVTEVNLAQLYFKLDPADPRVGESLERAFSCFEDPAAEYGSYYAHTCRKCAGAFADLGRSDLAGELNRRADALYAAD